MKYFRLGCLFCFAWYGSLQTIHADPIVPLNYTFTTINVPGSTSTSAYGLNDSGQIVGAYTDSAGAEHGFLDTSSTFTTLPFVPTGINNVGQIVGYSPDGVFLDTNGTITDIAVPSFYGATIDFRYLIRINDLGQIVGTFDKQGGFRQAFLYSDGSFMFFPSPTPEMEGPLFSANKINNAGQIVILEEGGFWTPLLYDSKTGQYTQVFPFPQFTDVYGTSINNLGQVLGSNVPGVFLTSNGSIGVFRLPDFPAISGFPYDVNDAGIFVGGNLLATPVPEPASLLLCASGLLGLGAALRRKHRA